MGPHRSPERNEASARGKWNFSTAASSGHHRVWYRGTSLQPVSITVQCYKLRKHTSERLSFTFVHKFPPRCLPPTLYHTPYTPLSPSQNYRRLPSPFTSTFKFISKVASPVHISYDATCITRLALLRSVDRLTYVPSRNSPQTSRMPARKHTERNGKEESGLQRTPDELLVTPSPHPRTSHRNSRP